MVQSLKEEDLSCKKKVWKHELSSPLSTQDPFFVSPYDLRLQNLYRL